jgi:hypothetical protein
MVFGRACALWEGGGAGSAYRRKKTLSFYGLYYVKIHHSSDEKLRDFTDRCESDSQVSFYWASAIQLLFIIGFKKVRIVKFKLLVKMELYSTNTNRS